MTRASTTFSRNTKQTHFLTCSIKAEKNKKKCKAIIMTIIITLILNSYNQKKKIKTTIIARQILYNDTVLIMLQHIYNIMLDNKM